VPFNEYSKLEAIAKKAKRSKLYMIREAIIKLADEMENNQ
jgi:predicted DNA-binding protein